MAKAQKAKGGGPELLAAYGQFKLYRDGKLYSIQDEISGQSMEMPLDAICLLQRMLIEELGYPD